MNNMQHTPEPWNCDGRTTLYATPDESGEMTMIEVNANVTEAGWDTVAFIEAIWPAAHANARRICAAVNACQGISTEALERGIIADLRLVLGELLTAAGDLDAAIDGVTEEFEDERDRLNNAIRNAQVILDRGTELGLHELLASRGQIAVGWSIADVKELRPDLTDKQAWQALEEVERSHDATIGINWDTLETVAENLFGAAPETDSRDD
jgi:hypothetical protein